jgi:hypothetical protein
VAQRYVNSKTAILPDCHHAWMQVLSGLHENASLPIYLHV